MNFVMEMDMPEERMEQARKMWADIKARVQSGDLPRSAEKIEDIIFSEQHEFPLELLTDYEMELYNRKETDELVVLLEDMFATLDLKGDIHEITLAQDLADAYAKRGEREKYEAITSDLIERYPDNEESLNARWVAMITDGRAQEVYDETRPYVEAKPEARDTQLTYSRFMEAAEELGRQEEAKQIIAKWPQNSGRKNGGAFVVRPVEPPKSNKKAPEPVVQQTTIHAAPKIGRNDPCPCGSGKKYKKCCGRNA